MRARQNYAAGGARGWLRVRNASIAGLRGADDAAAEIRRRATGIWQATGLVLAVRDKK
jgi:hypothetical protein